MRTYAGSIKKKKNRTGEECKEKVRKSNGIIPAYVGGTTDAWECTLHWTRIFSFVPIFYHFIIPTSQRSCIKHLIASSGKLLVATVQMSDGAANPQIICSKVNQIIVIQK